MEKKIEKFIAVINKILLNSAALALAGIVFAVTYQIITRNFLHKGCAWTEEVGRYLLIWMTFLGSPVALHKGEHLMVDLFYNMYPPKMRRWVNLLIKLAIFAFCAYMLYFGFMQCIDPRSLRFKSPAAQIPRSLIFAALPVGSFFMCLMALWDIYLSIQMIRGKREDTTAASVVNENLTLEELDALKRGGADK